MAKKAGTNDLYPATPDQLIAMMGSREYFDAKYVALQDDEFKILVHEATPNSVKLEVDRVVQANLPAFAKKVLGETNRLVQRETWTQKGSGYHADVVIDSPGKPIAITGTMDITPKGATESMWKVDFVIKGSLPLMGKVEEIVVKETQDNLVKEYAFNKKWLAEH